MLWDISMNRKNPEYHWNIFKLDLACVFHEKRVLGKAWKILEIIISI